MQTSDLKADLLVIKNELKNINKRLDGIQKVAVTQSTIVIIQRDIEELTHRLGRIERIIYGFISLVVITVIGALLQLVII